MGKFKFDVAIGNPPYQDEAVGDNKNFSSPIYHLFIDESYKVADKIELIHPARFLFNAGGTPKAWNRKMLKDPHLKIEHSEQDSQKVFPNTDIKGGVCVSYHDTSKEFGAIDIFTPYPELNSIVHKVCTSSFQPFNKIISSPVIYKIAEKLYQERPEDKAKLSQGNEYDIRTNVLDNLDDVFLHKKPKDGKTYVTIYGRQNNGRVERYIRKDYLREEPLIDKYKVLISEANGTGAFGEVLASPMIAGPNTASSQTFVPLGCCDTKEEAERILKYIKTKFCRAMLSVMKVTQHNSISTWGRVPMQDFSASSDIDWSQNIVSIDWQLYRKYGLTENEISFIEKNVREMA